MNAQYHILVQMHSALMPQVLTNVSHVKMDSEAGMGSVMVNIALKFSF